MRYVFTHNGLRLGDNLIHLNFLRRAALINPDVNFFHYYSPYLCNGTELAPFVEDIPSRINILPIEHRPSKSIDSWRGPIWYGHEDRMDFAKFHLFWFEHLASQMGVANPITSVDDLLFDYPLLYSASIPDFDVVVINSPALSGQFHAFDESAYNNLITTLVNAGYKVLTTKPTELCASAAGHNVAWIGAVAAKAKLVVGTSTGPSWPCFNVCNKNAKHIICLDSENVILTPRGSVARNVGQALQLLKEENFI